jgi:hypothetical protein
MNRKQQTFIAIGTVLIFLAALGYVLSTGRLSSNQSANPAQTPSTPKNGQAITATGTVTCLEHANASGPQTMECAMGLKTEAGSYYALGGDNSVIMTLGGDQKVRVTGTLSAPTTSTYKSAGTITVTSAEKL